MVEALSTIKAPVQGLTKVKRQEVIDLGAGDQLFFYNHFFPKTCRVPFAGFHEHKLVPVLDQPHSRFINLQMFRGSAKTSFLRMFAGRRIAYGLSRTILIIGASEDHAIRSVTWLKNTIEKNHVFRETFRLEPGNKWSGTELEIRHPLLDTQIWVKGVGITGNIRGINFEDYRPDLILLDDVVTDENAATLEQREKINTLVFGAVKNSLVTEAEDENAKLVIAQTPLHKKDITNEAMDDMEFVSVVVPCWTTATLGLPASQQESAWPERVSTSELRREKIAAMRRHRYSVFAKEKECKLVTEENSSFNGEFLQFWDAPSAEPLKMGEIIIAIDPVPPPSPTALAKNLHNKDYEAVSVLMRSRKNYYLLDYETNRGHDPSWSCQVTERFFRKYNALQVVFEAVAYQRVLGRILTEYLRRRRIYVPVRGIDDKRKKYNRIVSALNIAEDGKFYCSQSHDQFIQDFETYPNCDHDDLLDSVSLGLSQLVNPIFDMAPDDDGVWSHVQDEFNEPLNLKRVVP